MAKNINEKEMKELKRAYTNAEIEVLDDLHSLYNKIKKLDEKEPFALTSVAEVAEQFVKIENAIMMRCLVREFPKFYSDEIKLAKKLNKKTKSDKNKKKSKKDKK